MKYRMIALDMDGTLLDGNKTITPRTEAAIKAAGEKGVSVCLSTGRPLCGVQKYLRQLGMTTPVITCNGAVIANAATGEIMFRQCLEPEDARAVWRFGRMFDTTMCIWVGDRLYASEINDRTEDYKKLSGVEPVLIADFEELVQAGISKILWYDTPERIASFRDKLDAELNSGVSYVTSNPAFLEFFDCRVSKAKAMEFIGGCLGIPREQMIAVGDGENDLSMLSYAGLSVAMANASESVRSLCDYVTASNNEDGVALVIDRFCLGGYSER